MKIEELVRLINNIGEYHKAFSESFYKNRENINFKKFTVNKALKETSYNGAFMDLVDEYIKQVAHAVLVNGLGINKSTAILRCRGKNRESVLNKLYYYRHEKSDSNIPIQKCLNDIYGFRLIIETELGYEKILGKIKKSKALKVKLFRPYVRKDEKYQAIHIYFKSSNNIYFPWELQIWKKEDKEVNENEHKTHKSKRKYINWIDTYKRED